MSSYQKFVAVGNLGQDPETRHMESGSAVTNFSIAVSEKWKDKQTGEMRESTEWVRCVAFNRLGEVCGEYLKKGAKVLIEGKMKTRKWQDQQGNDRYTTEIVLSEMKMLDSRQGSGGSQNGSQGHTERPAPPPNQQQGAHRDERNPPPSDFDDDIPF